MKAYTVMFFNEREQFSRKYVAFSTSPEQALGDIIANPFLMRELAEYAPMRHMSTTEFDMKWRAGYIDTRQPKYNVEVVNA
jgi:hypothetical protein